MTSDPTDTPSPSSPPDSADRVAALEAELAAERAGAAHWRSIARRRSAQLDEIKGRTSVRAVLSAQRRTATASGRASQVVTRVGRLTRRGTLAISALPSRNRLGARGRAIDAFVAGLDPAPPISTSVLVVLLGDGTSHDVGAWERAGTPHATVVAVGGAEREQGRAVQAEAEASSAEVVALVWPTATGVAPGWLARLIAELSSSTGADDVVAAVPQVLHPARPATTATPHDRLVRARGLRLIADPDGTPWAEALGAGQPPRPGPPETIDAATAAVVVARRDVLLAVGGLVPTGDADADVIDLCVRLRGRGRIVVVPDALVADARPVLDRPALVAPVPTYHPSWRSVVERNGARLLPPGPTSFAITVAAPYTRIAEGWGDWHLAQALADALGRLGHPVRVQAQDRVDSLAGRACDVHLVVRGLAPVRATPGQRHVLWVISHPEDVDDAECDRADLVLVASPRFAAHLRTRTTTPVELLHQATDPHHFRPAPVDPRFAHDLTVVARSRDVLRPAVADALAAGLRPAVYGGGWEGLVPPGVVVADHVDYAELPAVYASARVVLNDHWDTMRTWGFVSNRIFDVAACETVVVSDPLPELVDLFGDLVPVWTGPDELRRVVDQLLADPAATAARVRDLRRRVLDGHTFDHRAQELLTHLARWAPQVMGPTDPPEPTGEGRTT